MLLKSIHISLNFVYTVVFDVETVPYNAKLAILEWLELQIFFTPSQPMLWGRLGTFPQEIFVVFYKNRDAIYTVVV